MAADIYLASVSLPSSLVQYQIDKLVDSITATIHKILLLRTHPPKISLLKLIPINPWMYPRKLSSLMLPCTDSLPQTLPVHLPLQL